MLLHKKHVKTHKRTNAIVQQYLTFPFFVTAYHHGFPSNPSIPSSHMPSHRLVRSTSSHSSIAHTLSPVGELIRPTGSPEVPAEEGRIRGMEGRREGDGEERGGTSTRGRGRNDGTGTGKGTYRDTVGIPTPARGRPSMVTRSQS